MTNASTSHVDAGQSAGLTSSLLCSDAWVSEFKKATIAVATSSESKSAAASAFKNISKLSNSAQQGDANAAKQAFVGAVTCLQKWSTTSGVPVKGL